MTNQNGNSDGGTRGEVHHADPNHAAVDPAAAATQDQVKADHDALEASAQRVESTVSADVRDTPVHRSDAASAGGNATTTGTTGTTSTTGTGGDVRHANPDLATVDRDAAAKQDRVKADHDVLQESARRVEASVPESVRETPVQQPDRSNSSGDDDAQSIRNLEDSRRNADAARESARRVEESTPEGQDRNGR